LQICNCYKTSLQLAW